jgi:hypothetical protein
MSADRELLDELARCFMRAALERLLPEQEKARLEATTSAGPVMEQQHALAGEPDAEFTATPTAATT